jgi:hypothetical protein
MGAGLGTLRCLNALDPSRFVRLRSTPLPYSPTRSVLVQQVVQQVVPANQEEEEGGGQRLLEELHATQTKPGKAPGLCGGTHSTINGDGSECK